METSMRSLEGGGSKDDWQTTFAQRLLDDHFLLTALEFHAELVDSGRELPKLREFFSNPSNFEMQSLGRPDVTLARSLSQGTLDSLDLARYSEDGERGNDEKVAVLEFELRKAKDTILALRANLTHVATSADLSPTPTDSIADNNSSIQVASPALIKPHEKRALNFSINEYLLLHGYKLTSITFADENESQDFDDWDDVGLNVPRPQELLHIYREGLKGCKTAEVSCSSVGCQTDEDISNNNLTVQLQEEVEFLQATLADVEKERDELINRLSNSHEQGRTERDESSNSPDMFEMIDGSSETKSVQSSEWTKVSEPVKEVALANVHLDSYDLSADDDAETLTHSMELKRDLEKDEEIIVELEKQTDSTVNVDIISPREIPEKFKRELLKCCDDGSVHSAELLMQITNNVNLSDLTLDHLVVIQASYLHKIIPNIILNKREEVIPILVLSICLCCDAKERDQLLSLLYNLKKKPQEEERQQILKAILAVAKALGTSFTEEELLPQCWEQIGHKYLERRLLVAEACCILTPYVSEMIRNSLILSMIQQLSQDREDAIRLCSVRGLTVLVTLISVPDKFTQFCDLCITLLADPSPAVSQQVLSVLMPAVAQWSCELRQLQTHLLDRLLICLRRAPSIVMLSALESLLPYLVMFIANSETVMSRIEEPHPLAAKRQEFAFLCKGLYDPLIFFGNSVGRLVSAFDHVTINLEESSDWPELDWVMAEMLPRILKVAEENWNQTVILKKVALFIRHLCAGLGKNITYNLIKPELSRRLEICSSGLIAGEARNLEMIPLYIVGVLSLGQKDGAGPQQVGGTLLEFLFGLPLGGAPILTLYIAIESLFAIDTFQVIVLDTLWEGVVHLRPLVRSATATLFQSVLDRAPDELLASRIVPALVTLASDPELSVRLAVIPTLAILGDTHDIQTRDKITMTFQALLSDAVNGGNESIALELCSTMAEYWEKFDVAFKNDVILSQLALLAASCNGVNKLTLVKALTETFSEVVFSPSQLSSESLTIHVIPALRCLENNCRQLGLSHGERVESLLRHAERLIPSTTVNAPAETIALSPVARVEDVKNRVSKMFNTRPQSLQSVSGIFKKKT